MKTGAERQTDLLASYILENFPDKIKGPSGGAGDVAIEILKEYKKELKDKT